MNHVYFNAKDGNRLEGILQRVDNAPAVVITHPHPLYGGTMHNYVLDTIESTFFEKGHTTLRFNFRGVGKSEGNFSDGKGELNDVLGAIEYIRENGAKQVVLVGYSFGAWVNAHVPAEMRPEAMIMISPPVAMMDFSDIPALPSLKLVITGEKDDIAPPSLIKKQILSLNPDAKLHVIDNTDHFYGSGLPALKSIIQESME